MALGAHVGATSPFPNVVSPTSHRYAACSPLPMPPVPPAGSSMQLLNYAGGGTVERKYRLQLQERGSGEVLSLIRTKRERWRVDLRRS